MARQQIELAKLDMSGRVDYGDRTGIATVDGNNEPCSFSPTLLMKPTLQSVIPPPTNRDMRTERYTLDLEGELYIVARHHTKLEKRRLLRP
jgi:hypothetical protein